MSARKKSIKFQNTAFLLVGIQIWIDFSRENCATKPEATKSLINLTFGKLLSNNFDEM